MLFWDLRPQKNWPKVFEVAKDKVLTLIKVATGYPTLHYIKIYFYFSKGNQSALVRFGKYRKLYACVLLLQDEWILLQLTS